VALGFAKHSSTLNRMLPTFNSLIHRVRKIRIMGAAALSMVYVATGRMDAYVEYGLRLWDIAAGGLILECAGGVVVSNLQHVGERPARKRFVLWRLPAPPRCHRERDQDGEQLIHGASPTGL